VASFIVIICCFEYYAPEGKGKIVKIENERKAHYAILDNKSELFIGYGQIKAEPGDTIEKKANSFVYIINNKEINALMIKVKEGLAVFVAAFLFYFMFISLAAITGVLNKTGSSEKK
jgi:hypothetical protein